MRINPDSFVFTLRLGFLSSLPTFGIDMILPSLSATGADLGAAPADVGLALSVYLLSLGTVLLVYGRYRISSAASRSWCLAARLSLLRAWAACLLIHYRSCCF